MGINKYTAVISVLTVVVIFLTLWSNKTIVVKLGFVSQINNKSLGYRRATGPYNNLTSEKQDLHNEQLQLLGNLVQQLIHRNQNPNNCENRKKIVCNFIRNAGFGSQMFDWTFCLIVALATNRTLVIKSKGWPYTKDGMEQLFLPVSTNCMLTHNQSTVQENDLRKIKYEKEEAITIPRAHKMNLRSLYLPIVIPDDVTKKITRVHSNPAGWLVGHS
ncbi:alpha-(1,6)-fucosyltransferase-like [Ruditapes philippinarum]|uniref:alpha-(1,6)-fucosyltransferase-like n=1 Tax=Ruditapes philippinarum TaxID=129788 RepID=UPI00295C260E|nr:alpha-(1,6)-fucosyltransferase-like [Ruditapes philippinarum]